ncbi:hypothetical protein GH714_020073 [Hevea brasiliensis]|uniref:AP2/ERF domain-containing protein n=1 Tax=Hevea brasiliensis TaxID=3981 RepID=A0A6A6MG82_HEVBR|nr:hypothetical protein GH714_020073 [Hevea brasiliensis]
MDGSCIDESTTSDSISISISITPKSAVSSFPPPTKSPESPLCRVGSGSSVILDSESGVEAESRKLPSSKYKGVVPQPNGRWGAQIYEKHQRVWLGTFNEEDEAAKAYDIAAQRFRGRDAITNFKPQGAETEEDDIETAFLNSHSKAEIVDMLRKHTYNDELEQSKRNYRIDGQGKQNRNPGANNVAVYGSDRVLKAREQLFEKAVTPSDVGKLNRLVIPKQHERNTSLYRAEAIAQRGAAKFRGYYRQSVEISLLILEQIEFGTIIQDCRRLLQQVVDVSIGRVRRNCNEAVHSLAKIAHLYPNVINLDLSSNSCRASMAFD